MVLAAHPMLTYRHSPSIAYGMIVTTHEALISYVGFGMPYVLMSLFQREMPFHVEATQRHSPIYRALFI